MFHNNLLRIAALPLDIALGDRQANLAAVHNALATLPTATDIVLLPELFSTGFIPDAEAARTVAETNGGDTIAAIQRWANKYGCAFAGSFLAQTASRLYNRAFFIEPNGDETFYDKAHLFSLSPEKDIMTAGTKQPPVIRFRAWNIALAICYDLRFPAWCRVGKEPYDVLLLPSNWPQARAYAFETLLRARAIENQAAVVAGNRGGEDSFGIYDGLTLAFDCMGKPVVAHNQNPWLVFELDGLSQRNFRAKFPFLKDADTFHF